MPCAHDIGTQVNFALHIRQQGNPAVINPEDEVCFDLRTSCTEEEAVAKLLGWMQGSKRLRYLTVTEDGLIPDQLVHMYELPVALDELIRDEREMASIRFCNYCVEKNFLISNERQLFESSAAGEGLR